MLILFGIVMYVSERFRTKKRLEGIGVVDALLIGIAQALALMPGVSRAGVTIAAGLMMGVKREDAARFSFLLSMPAVAGAMVLEGRELIGNSENHDLALVAVGFAAALVTGIFAIKFLLKYLRKHTLNVFIIYRFVLAGIIMGWLWLGG
jgi:undecaprenyl-diphosphatase